MRRLRADDGFATVLGIGLMLVLGCATALVVLVGTAAVTRHRAESAADLAALAAAGHAVEGPTAACAAARMVAEAHGVQLLDCRLVGNDVEVDVGVRAPGRLAAFGLVRARARAGRR